MAKLTLSDISGGYLAPALINANNTLLETALENTLSRDGTSPNTMSANFDMNSYKILNLAAPVNLSDAARLSDVQAAIAGDTDASLITYTQSGTGATERTVASKVGELYSVTDFGAVGNGSTDDTTAIQAAITAVQGNTCGLFFPPGTYKITGTLTITGSISIWGLNRASTAISWTSNTLNVFSIASDTEVHFKDITLYGPLTSSAGKIINLAGSATHNSMSTFKNVTFVGGWDQLYTTSAYGWVVDSCVFTGFGNTGLVIQNTYNVDAGDSKCVNSVFANGDAGTTCILQLSSGGFRLINSKINTGAYGYRLTLASAAVTSDLTLVGNSFENTTTAAVSLETLGGGATFTQVVISGNQIALTPKGIQVPATTAFLSILNISGNSIALNGSGTYAILLAGGTIGYIGGNTLYGGGGTPIGVSVGSSTSYITVGENKYHALTSNCSISTGSTGTIGPDGLLEQSGTSISCGADTTEDTLATIKIPGKQMGIHGRVKVRLKFFCTNSANNKTFRARFSGGAGTIVFSTVETTISLLSVDLDIYNLGAANSQLSNAVYVTNAPATNLVQAASAIDTTADTTLVITGQKANSGEVLTLQTYSVELIGSRT